MGDHNNHHRRAWLEGVGKVFESLLVHACITGLCRSRTYRGARCPSDDQSERPAYEAQDRADGSSKERTSACPQVMLFRDMDLVLEVAVHYSDTYQQNILFLLGLNELVVGPFGSSLVGKGSYDHLQRHINVRVAAGTGNVLGRVIRLVDLMRSLRDLRQWACFG